MNTVVVMLLFLGMVLVIHGINDEKLKQIESKTRVEYRFLPRTLYEEQLSNDPPNLVGKFKSMFQESSPWT